MGEGGAGGEDWGPEAYVCHHIGPDGESMLRVERDVGSWKAECLWCGSVTWAPFEWAVAPPRMLLKVPR